MRRLCRFAGQIMLAAGVNHETPFLPWYGQLVAFLVVAAAMEWGYTGTIRAEPLP